MVAVGCYLRYNLSYRDVSEILNERGINVCHTMFSRWVQEYSQIIITYGRKEINLLAIHGEWMKLISK